MLLLDDALAGGGRLVLCTGEAGIGKTRLAEEAAASAAARGVPVAWARAADRDSLPPYGPDAAGSAWLEMWGRLWRIDTLFETGQLRSVRRELADLESCVERLPGPLAQWHFLETSALLALATGRFTEATRLAADAFKAFSDMGHPFAFGGCSVILGQAGLHIGFGRSGMIELWDQIPAHLRPDAVDTTRGVATVFPALTLALIRLQQGDRAAAEAAYAQAGPVRSWTPVPAMRMAAWAHGLAVAIGLGRAEDIEFLAARFEPFRGQHVANGAGPGVSWARSSCRSDRRPPRWAISTRRLKTCRRRPRSATPTAPVAAPCKPASNSPPRSPADRRPATGTRRWPRWPPPRARPNSSGWSRSPNGSNSCKPS